MKNVLVFALGAVFSISAIAPAYSGQAYDALRRFLQEQGFENVKAIAVKEDQTSLVVSSLTADRDGSSIKIEEVSVVNPRSNEAGFSADQMVFLNASQQGEGLVVGFSKLNMTNVDFPFMVSLKPIGLTSAIMTDVIAMDETMNAFSVDRFIFTRDERGGNIDIGFSGHISGNVLSSLIPWTLSDVSSERVGVRGTMKMLASGDGGATLSSQLKLEGYGNYGLGFELSEVSKRQLNQPNSLIPSYEDVKIEKVEFSLSHMEWLGEALARHPSELRTDFIDYISRISGGAIASLGNLEDGLLLKSTVKAFMEAPSSLTVSASPGFRIKDLSGKREPRSLDLNIVESVSAGERKDKASDSVIE